MTRGGGRRGGGGREVVSRFTIAACILLAFLSFSVSAIFTTTGAEHPCVHGNMYVCVCVYVCGNVHVCMYVCVCIRAGTILYLTVSIYWPYISQYIDILS